jgi:hypothetical protein
MVHCRTPWLAALGLAGFACQAGGGAAPASADTGGARDADAGTPDARPASAADAAVRGDAGPSKACACAAAPEDCDACFRLISRCCDLEGGDETFGGRLDAIMRTCEANPRCAACCDECAARTCEQVRAAGDCPIRLEDPPG